jgi:hypothetical protein
VRFTLMTRLSSAGLPQIVVVGALVVLIAVIGQDREGDDGHRALEQNGIGTDRPLLDQASMVTEPSGPDH